MDRKAVQIMLRCKQVWLRLAARVHMNSECYINTIREITQQGRAAIMRHLPITGVMLRLCVRRMLADGLAAFGHLNVRMSSLHVEHLAAGLRYSQQVAAQLHM